MKGTKIKHGMMILIVLMMVGTSFSIILYGFNNPGSKSKQNGISFVYNGNFWLAKVSGRQTAFSYLPSDTIGINISGAMPNLMGMIEIDTTSDSFDKMNQSIALAEHLMEITLNEHGIYLRNGFTSNNSYVLPIIQCKDATNIVPVIYFKSSNSTKITVEGSCIIAEATRDIEFLRVKDRLLYNILGVLNG